MFLIKLVRLCIRFQHKIFPFFFVGHRKDSERNEGFRPFGDAFIQTAWKQSECLVLRVVSDEEFLHNKVKNKDLYVFYGATEDIPKDTCSLRQYVVWREI